MIWYAAKTHPAGTHTPRAKAGLIVVEFASRTKKIQNAKQVLKRKKRKEQASAASVSTLSASTSPASSASSPVSPASFGGVSPASSAGVSLASSGGLSPASDASAGEQAVTLWRESGSQACAAMQELDGAAEEEQLHGEVSPASSGEGTATTRATGIKRSRRGCIVCTHCQCNYGGGAPAMNTTEIIGVAEHSKLRGQIVAIRAERDILARKVVELKQQGLDYWDSHIAARQEAVLARRAAKLSYENDRLLG
jgi:hypothetical protein